jgi:hypothetical protein
MLMFAMSSAWGHPIRLQSSSAFYPTSVNGRSEY